jgi:hypothetical protein
MRLRRLEWVDLALDMVQWPALLGTAVQLHVFRKGEEYLHKSIDNLNGKLQNLTYSLQRVSVMSADLWVHTRASVNWIKSGKHCQTH